MTENKSTKPEPLKKLIKIYSGYSPGTFELNSNDGIPYIKVGTLVQGEKWINNTHEFVENSNEKYHIPTDSIVFPKRGAAILNNKISIAKVPMIMDTNLMAIKSDSSKLITEYLYYFLLNKKLFKIADTSSIPQINNKHILPILINLPSLQEQKKIAEILSTWDDAIKLYSNIIRTFDDYKQSLIQKIIFDEQNIFKTRKIKIRNLLKERTDKSNGNEEVHSVSVKRGIINQIEHLGRVFAAKDTSKYNLVKYGDIVYTKSPTGDFPFGIIKQSYIHENVIVSPLYGVYEPINYYTGKYLNAFFESAIRTNNMLAPIIQKGAKNTINITNDRFLDGKIKFPHNESTIILISKIMDEIDQILVKYESILFLVEKQKQGLMQQLLTGSIRVKVS